MSCNYVIFDEEKDGITANKARAMAEEARERMREEIIEAAKNTFKNEIASAIRRAARDGDQYTSFWDGNLIKNTVYYSCIVQFLRGYGFEVTDEAELTIGIYW